MASAFAHALTAYTLGKIYPVMNTGKFFMLGIFCAVIPDADVVTFAMDIPYESMWGHRGFTHSILFALMLALLVNVVFYSRIKLFSSLWAGMFVYFFLCTISHGMLDALTSGGLGVAFFAPFDNSRYFFPFTPIRVSPIGFGRFFGEWGLRVLRSEFFWVGLPCIVVLLLTALLKRIKVKSNRPVD